MDVGIEFNFVRLCKSDRVLLFELGDLQVSIHVMLGRGIFVRTCPQQTQGKRGNSGYIRNAVHMLQPIASHLKE